MMPFIKISNLAPYYDATVSLDYAEQTGDALGNYPIAGNLGDRYLSIYLAPATNKVGTVSVVKEEGGSVVLQYNGASSMTKFTNLTFGSKVGVKISPQTDHKVTGMSVINGTLVSPLIGPFKPGEVVLTAVEVLNTDIRVQAHFDLAPTAHLSLAVPIKAVVGNPIYLNSAGTTSNDKITSYEFRVDGQSVYRGADPLFAFTPTAAKTYAIKLIVSTERGGVFEKSANINVVTRDEVYNPLCLGCHGGSTPQVIADYRAGIHGRPGISCVACHTDSPHQAVPDPQDCIGCHSKNTPEITSSFSASAHAGQQSCQGCHPAQPHGAIPDSSVCAGCHSPLPHGEGLTGCIICHDPHSLSLSVGGDFSIDYPHSSISCSTCHDSQDGSSRPADRCLTCHDGTSATAVVTHANTSAAYGNWAIQCITCHDPHRQDQRFVYGEDSFIVSGTSDAGGITSNSLTMTGAGWAENSLADMVLFPDLSDTSKNYKILGNTEETITVRGPMDWFQTTDGNTNFAAVYGRLIRDTIATPNSGDREVRLFRETGINSFADGDAIYDGICEACHTKTRHHRNDGTAVEQSHYDGTRCTSCHTHANGFGGFDHSGAVATGF